jgi:UDP-N-acetylmuramyl-tripeptide synthetase
MNKLFLIKPLINTNKFDGCKIFSITDDSRDVQNNSLFVARQGVQTHGIEFIKEAIQNGASCIISDKEAITGIDIPIHYVNDLEDKIVEILFSFHELFPSNFFFHGVTGTNGKTTTAFMAHNILRELDRPSIYIGTLGAIINDDAFPTKGNTTPGIFEIFEILKRGDYEQKVFIFLEISSHALDQNRLRNLPFLQTMILNIQSDHLDYHKSDKNYIAAKLSIIKLNNKNPTIVLIDKIQDLLPNFQEKQKEELSKTNFLSNVDSFATYNYSLDINPDGSSKINLNFPNLNLEINTSLFLRFNVENYISAIALISEHLSQEELENIDHASIPLPQGRGELLRLDQGSVLIDFAHDHQSMRNILSALGNTYDEIILAFGCGGDRDKSKRPKMMKVAIDMASKVFLTSDNNRNESFSSIASDALDGNEGANVQIIEDRAEAIASALQCLNKNNILVILGKGHERFMEVSGKKIPFNDRDCVLKLLSNEIN